MATQTRRTAKPAPEPDPADQADEVLGQGQAGVAVPAHAAEIPAGAIETAPAVQQGIAPVDPAGAGVTVGLASPPEAARRAIDEDEPAESIIARLSAPKADRRPTSAEIDHLAKLLGFRHMRGCPVPDEEIEERMEAYTQKTPDGQTAVLLRCQQCGESDRIDANV